MYELSTGCSGTQKSYKNIKSLKPIKLAIIVKKCTQKTYKSNNIARIMQTLQ